MYAEILQDIINFENGTLESGKVPELFQRLIDSKMIYDLQGRYQRIAQELIACGMCTAGEPPNSLS